MDLSVDRGAALSLSSVTVGVGVDVLGHANIPDLAVVFGGLGCFAYAVWLLHASASHRDSLRAHRTLGNPATPPLLRYPRRRLPHHDDPPMLGGITIILPTQGHPRI